MWPSESAFQPDRAPSVVSVKVTKTFWVELVVILQNLEVLTHSSLETLKGSLANSADSDQLLQNVASDHGQHCLH